MSSQEHQHTSSFSVTFFLLLRQQFFFLASPKWFCNQVYPLISLHRPHASTCQKLHEGYTEDFHTLHTVHWQDNLSHLTCGFDLECHLCCPQSPSKQHTPNKPRTGQPTMLNEEISDTCLQQHSRNPFWFAQKLFSSIRWKNNQVLQETKTQTNSSRLGMSKQHVQEKRQLCVNEPGA